MWRDPHANATFGDTQQLSTSGGTSTRYESYMEPASGAQVTRRYERREVPATRTNTRYESRSKRSDPGRKRSASLHRDRSRTRDHDVRYTETTNGNGLFESNSAGTLQTQAMRGGSGVYLPQEQYHSEAHDTSMSSFLDQEEDDRWDIHYLDESSGPDTPVHFYHDEERHLARDTSPVHSSHVTRRTVAHDPDYFQPSGRRTKTTRTTRTYVDEGGRRLGDQDGAYTRHEKRYTSSRGDGRNKAYVMDGDGNYTHYERRVTSGGRGGAFDGDSDYYDSGRRVYRSSSHAGGGGWHAEYDTGGQSSRSATLPHGSGLHYASRRGYTGADFDSNTAFVERGGQPSGIVTTGPPGSSKFLQEVQYELEDRRLDWKDEMDRLSENFISSVMPTDGTIKRIKSNYVDMSTGKPIFRAHFDMRQYDQRDVQVEIDMGRIVVTAEDPETRGRPRQVTKKFTQRVRLPHFSDERSAKYFFEPGGILTVEVPLIYYFPRKDKKTNVNLSRSSSLKRSGSLGRYKGRHPSSKLLQTTRTADGRKAIKMALDLEPMINPDTIQVHIVDDRRVRITADGHKEKGRGSAGMLKFSKEMRLPRHADLEEIRSNLDADGTLWIEVPIMDRHVSYRGGSRSYQGGGGTSERRTTGYTTSTGGSTLINVG